MINPFLLGIIVTIAVYGITHAYNKYTGGELNSLLFSTCAGFFTLFVMFFVTNNKQEYGELKEDLIYEPY